MLLRISDHNWAQIKKMASKEIGHPLPDDLRGAWSQGYDEGIISATDVIVYFAEEVEEQYAHHCDVCDMGFNDEFGECPEGPHD